MAFNFLERLGTMFGQRVAERVLGRDRAPAAEATPAEAPAAETPAEPAPADTYQAPATEPVAEAAPATETPTYGPTESVATTTPESAVTAPATDAYAAPAADAAPAAPAEPARSAEELEEERLWTETDAAWAAGDFNKVTVYLDRLRELQPEDAAEIDQKIAAAQFNQAQALEQSGELDRALYLYHEAQRRNPNLGEASYAIERVQAALQPAPAPEAAAAPAEQTYTVESGDSLWAIAQKVYGDGNQWSRIHDANRDQIDNPDMIQPGQVLRIPS